MVKNEDNEKTKYEEDTNDSIMEYEGDNIIEYLESEKQKTLDLLDSAINNKKRYIFQDVVVALGWLISSIYLLCTKFFSLGAIFSCTFVISTIINAITTKLTNDTIKGYKTQLQFLEEKLKEEKKKEIAEKDKEKEIAEQDKEKEIAEKDKEKEIINEKNEKSKEELEKQINEINRRSNLYYDMGAYEKRLAKYYKLGMLKEYLNKISERYNESDINLIENYLEEKGREKTKVNK